MVEGRTFTFFPMLDIPSSPISVLFKNKNQNPNGVLKYNKS